VPLERISWTFEFEGMPGHVSVDTVSFEEHAGTTKVTVVSLFENKGDRDGMAASGMEKGATESTERLDELLKDIGAGKDRKEMAVEFLNSIGAGRPKEGLRFFAPDCETHNPYVAGGMDALTDAMIAVQKESASDDSESDFGLKIRHVVAEGDLVAVHTDVSSSKPSEGGLRQVHLFRFNGDKIVEYWDVTQQIQENSPNPDGAF
jgi:predicted SnoaL-like aldol condensation-catalyzing enzyme